MTNKTNVLTSILKLTNIGFATQEAVAMDAKIPLHVANDVLKGLRELGLVECENGKIEVSSNQRVKLATHAINHGTDIERVCKVLEWKEFENFSATAFETNNFAVKRRVRFKESGRRWEIDILANSEPIVVSVDCKRWRRGWGNSAIAKVAVAQAQRTEALAKALHPLRKRIGLEGWKKAILFPAIISLFSGPVKFYSNVPVIPILQLQNFLDEFQGHTNELKHFRARLEPELADYFNSDQ